MKSLMKKLVAVIIAAATMLGFAGLGAAVATAADVTPSWATASDTGSITVNTAEGFAADGQNPYALKYYQMFTANVEANDSGADKTDNTKTKVTYTLNADWKAFFTSTDTTTAGTNFVDGAKTVDQQAVEYILGLTEAQRADFANHAQQWAATNIKNEADKDAKFGTVTPATKDSKSVTISNLPAGYYLIAPDEHQLGQQNKYQALLVNLTDTAKNVSVQLKHEFPTVDKTVDDKHASENKIGDVVNYKLTSTVPDMYKYELGYTFNFLDTLSKGLTLSDAQGNAITDADHFEPVVKIEGSNTPDTGKTYQTLKKGDDQDYKVTVTNNGDTTSIAIIMNDFRQKHQNDHGKTITVEYSATLNENAVVGKQGNPNSAQVQYSNDPTNNGTGTSVPSEVKSHTFGFTIDKYTGKDYSEFAERLAGATFKVYKNTTVNNNDQADKDAGALKFNVTDGDGSNSAIAQYAKDQTAALIGNLKDEVTTPKSGRIEVGGLLPGTYWIEETQAPEGYNKLTEMIKVVISAKYDTADGKINGAVSGTQTGKLVSWKVEYTQNNNGGTATEDKIGEPPVLPVLNVNKDNVLLPGTGSIGTMLFTVFGALIIIGGAVWYVRSNRKTTK
ncbi:cell surface protein [Bifidobacterium goeldii]|uniref:Cell surface protein n=1 Tax=Bifidobacterium goeldii TaxID=2306975 RepID=A0A430FK22_9BIFI|nr:SpaH/EbpB family LPXTG-anchored major pilin [Bifidobacterium goeldii]RSX53177.1 cell surface protein [Bifidobacterium goeldii]